MAAERGSAFLLKIGSGGVTPTFATVAGLKTTNLAINGDLVAVTSKDSGGVARAAVGGGGAIGIGRGERDLHGERSRSAGARTGAVGRRRDL